MGGRRPVETRAPMRARAVGALGWCMMLAWLASGCAHAPGGPSASSGGDSDRRAPEADSVTIALWHFDEGSGVRLTDSGPFRLDAVAGLEIRPDFGRFAGARRFSRTLDSFGFVAANPELIPGSGLTCELWVYPTEFGQYELTPLAACWNEQPDQRSWLFALGGQYYQPPRAALPSPGFFNVLVPAFEAGKLIFAYQPEAAGSPVAYLSSSTLPLNRWTHVAVTFDGQVVRFWIDGLQDAQYASRGHIRLTRAPMLIGNYLDPRYMTAFSGSLKSSQQDQNPYYAFVGSLDELRISSRARIDFPQRAPKP